MVRHMKRSPRKRTAGNKSGTARQHSTDRQIVLFDQGPLRRKAASECGQAMARLDKARAEWKRFEQEDKPGFARWTAATFGALLSQLRETEAKVLEKQALVEEVEMEMLYTGTRNPKAAYAKILRRGNNPPPEAEAKAGDWSRFEQGPPPMEEEFPEPDEFEQNLLFEDFLRVVMGINPDRMSDKKYEQMFEEFKANVFGGPPPEPVTPRRSKAEEAKPERSRLKELYRLLVRRLHPDTRAENDADVSAIWHEVQEAYSKGNVERLEMLLALTDIQSNTAGEHTTLSQMRAVLVELRRSFNAMQRDISRAKKEPAWNFTRMTDRSKLEKRMRNELEEKLDWCLVEFKELEMLLARWAAPAKGKKKVAASAVQQTFF